MSTTDLESRIDDGTATDEDWRVFGDLLSARGDPRGELVAISFALDDASSDEEIEKLERRRATYQKRIDGALHGRATLRAEFFQIEYARGFVDRARVVEPWDPMDPPATVWLAELLGSPAARLLRSLEIDRGTRDDVPYSTLGTEGLLEWALPVFEKIGELPRLRRFRVGSEPDKDMHLSEMSSGMVTSAAPGTPGANIFRPDLWIGDVTPVLALMPNLAELHLTGEGIAFESLPKTLRTLRIQSRFVRASTLHALSAAALPKLETLELWLGNWPDSAPEFEGPEAEAFYGRATTVGDIAPLLEGTRTPALRKLALSNCAWMPELVAAVVASPLVEQLDELDLSYGFMTSPGAAPLLEHASKLRRLKRIDLSYNQIEESMQALLAAELGPALLLEPQEELRGNLALRLLAF